MAAQRRQPSKDDDGEFGRRPRALRPFWSGTLTFGLVSVPVELYAGHRAGGFPLRLLAPDGTPVVRRYVCTAHRQEREVDRDDIVRGYEIEPGRYVVVEDRELEALAPRRSRDIDLRRFVTVDAIPARHFQRAYFLTPAGDTTKAYRLLAAVMEERGLAGLATFVMRGREYLVAILAGGGILRAETLRFADELREPGDVGLKTPRQVPAKAVERMRGLVRDHRLAEIPEGILVDEAAEALRQLVARKDHEGRDVITTRRGQSKGQGQGQSKGKGKGKGKGRGERADTAAGGGAEVVDLLQIIRQRLRGDDGERGLSKEELYRRAREQDIPGRSRMSKDELVQALQEAG